MKKPKQNNLTAKEIQNFRAMLLKKRSEILGDVMCMENEALRKSNSDLSNLPVHMADLGTDNFDTENTLGLMEGERKLLEEIYDALERIENGTYGICESNGEPIPKARLKAIPWARHCVACATNAEKRQNNKVRSLDTGKGQTLRLAKAAEEQEEDIDNFA